METIEQALQEVGRLHEQVTRSPAPEIEPQAFLPFPPGVDPVAYAIEEVSRLRQILDGQGQSTTGENVVAWVPRASVFAGASSLIFAVELPGVDRDEVSVTVEGGEMVVRGVRQPPRTDPALKPVVVEQVWGAFERRFPIPIRCNTEQVKARYHLGILEITLPCEAEANSGGFRVEIG